MGHRDGDALRVVKAADMMTLAESVARVGTPDFSDIVAAYGIAVVKHQCEARCRPGGLA
jgi:hypothetical protein